MLALTSTASLVERHPPLAILLLAAVYLPAVLFASKSRLMWHDEIFTFYIADAPTLSAMLHKSQLDLNPPLSYILTYFSLRLFGPSTLACRLPEMAAFFAAMIFLYAFLKQYIGVLYGVFAAALLFSGLAGELAIEARPYSLLLSFVCLSLLAWQKARSIGTTRRLGLLLLALGSAGILLSHVFGLLAWTALLLGEIVRTIERKNERKKIDWAPLAVWTVPLLSTSLYLPMLRSHGASAFPPAFQPVAEDVFTFYISHLDRELTTLLLTAAVIFVLPGRHILRGYHYRFLSVPDWVATAGILVSPGVLIGYLMLTHGAFFPRYGVTACVGVAIFFSTFLAWWSGLDRRAALLGSVMALLISGQITAAIQGLPLLCHPLQIMQASEPVIDPCQVCALTASIDPTLPLVDASGLTFLEMDHRESAATLARVLYLTDPVASMQFAHASIFEAMQVEADLFPIRARVQPYQTFLHQHRHFFVFGRYDYPEDWLLRKLQAEGADIRLRGRVTDQYKDQEVYEISL